jgi:beta-phosphoglucomutase-like phosphatase (HAD superfamily)/choline kinase
MNIIIPLGGKGERFKNSGYIESKPLIKILDKEMIFYVLDNLKISDLDNIFIIYNDWLEEYNFCEKIRNKNNKIQFIRLEKQTLGAAETLYIGTKHIMTHFKSNVNKNVMILDCDTFYTEDIVNKYKNSQNKNCVFYTRNYEEKPIYSYIKLNEDNKIYDIIEKVKISDNANTGIYCFENIEKLNKYCLHVINNDIKFNNEYYTSCVISEMIKDNNDFYGIELDPIYVFNLGTPNQVNQYLDNTFVFLFDLDGTLVLTDDIYFHVWEKILLKYNISLTQEIFDKIINGNSDRMVVEKLNIYLQNIDIISEEKDRLFIENIEYIKVIEGVTDFLEKLKRLGYKVGIVTNCNRKIAELILNKTKINTHVDVLIIGNECKKPKPYPEPYIDGIMHFNSSNEKTIIFEDSKVGFLSANGSNPRCLVGLTTNFNIKDLIQLGCNICINNYLSIDIKTILENKNNKLLLIEKYVKDSINLDINKVSINSNKMKGGYISDVLECTLKLYDGKNLNCVIKIENKNESFLQKMANELGLYEREYYFYESIYKMTNINVPKCHGIVYDENFHKFGILMENLTETHNINLNLNKENIDVSLIIISRLAKFHSKFWNKDVKNIFTEIKKHDDALFVPSWGNFIKSKKDIFISKWKLLLNDNDIKNIEYIANNFLEIQKKLSDTNLTVCHGDVKSPNIFYRKEDNEPCFIDWQYVNLGKGVQDLVFFMIESFEIDKINIYGNIFKYYYYAKIIEYGVKNYSKEEYENDFKNAICYFPFFVAIWFGTLNDEDLIDKNFPYFFINKLLNFMRLFLIW